MSNQIVPVRDNVIEQVLLGGDLSRLTPAERLSYYKRVCESLGLNPLTRPFDYITLNGKLTLYARKDAAEQLRDKHGISIDKPDIRIEDDWIIVTVMASNKEGRTDSDVGVVSKKDMRGDFGNSLMKAVTKAKRRVTLSICGLGMLDETEVETIPVEAPAPQIVEVNGDLQEQPTITVNHKHHERPLPPELLAEMLNKKAAGYVGREVSEKQHGLFSGMIDNIVMGDEDKRRTVLLALFGVTSRKDVLPEQVLAGIDWLKPTKDSGGAYAPDPMAVKEAEAVWTAALKTEGQQELL